MNNVLIRPLKIEDAKVSFHWRNDPDIWQFTGKRPDRFITEEIETEWLKCALNDCKSFRFAIIADNKYVGNIQITNIKEGKTGEYHIFIGQKEFWGHGIATLATAQLIIYAKEKLKLQHLYLTVNPLDKQAIRVYEKSGFKRVSEEIRMKLDLNHLPTTNDECLYDDV